MQKLAEIYDITRPVSRGTALWPGDPPMEVDWPGQISKGDSANVARVTMGMHTGTHVDAPFHVSDSGARIGEVGLQPFLGRARLVEVEPGGRIDAVFAAEILRDWPSPRRLLIRTRAWKDDRFPEIFPAVEPEAVRLLAERGVILIGTDAPSVDRFDAEELSGHEALVSAGIAILENLLLDEVPLGEYELIALPLKLIELDGSPVRAVLRPLQ